MPGHSLLSSPCLTVPGPQVSTVPSTGSHSFNLSGNSYSYSETQMTRSLPAVRFHQCPRTPSQAASHPWLSLHRTLQHRARGCPEVLGYPQPGQAPLSGCWDPGGQLERSLCSGLQLHLGGWYLTLTFISEKNNFLHTRWRKRTISRTCVASLSSACHRLDCPIRPGLEEEGTAPFREPLLPGGN